MKAFYSEVYDEWKTRLSNSADGQILREMSLDEIEDAFSGNLAFGTGGLRGIMGLGTNRMNRYTVERVTHGLAKTVLSGAFPKSVGVAYDIRHNSAGFAKNVCDILCAYGIDVHVFDKPMPTPALSFAIRFLNLGWGIVITASHNPREYNGYKVYDNKGIQLTDYLAAEVSRAVETIEYFKPVPKGKHAQISIFAPEVEAAYIEQIVSYATRTQAANDPTPITNGCSTPATRTPLPPIIPNSEFQIPNSRTKLPLVYSALHGTGANAIPAVLKNLGFSPLLVQQNPDGDFGGIETPNPEEPEVYEKALKEAEKTGAKLLCATDPDCDRVGVMVKTEQGFKMLNGNQIGALLIDYLAQTLGVSIGDTIISTVVSGVLGELIAKSYGLEFVRLLTGFKYIGEYAEQLPVDKKFFFGYEESYGYLAGDGARDKDAVISSALIAQMAGYYDQRGMTLIDRWHELSQKHGYCLEALRSINIPQSEQKEIMSRLRSGLSLEGLIRTEDYLPGLNGLPPSDVLKFYFEDGSWAAIRPSGTEPKIKLYTGVCADTYEKATTALDTIGTNLLAVLEE